MPAVGLDFLLPTYVGLQYAFQDVVVPPNPAAGATFARTVPGETVEVVVSVAAVLTTSATAATRQVILRVRDQNDARVFSLDAALTQAASLAYNYRWSLAIGNAYTTAGNTSVVPAFPFAIVPGWNLQLDCSGIQVGDQFSAIAVVLRRYWTGPVGETKADAIELPTALDTVDIEHPSSAPAVGAAEAPAAPAPSPSSPAPSGPSAPAPSSEPRAPTPGVTFGHAVTEPPPPTAPPGTREPA